MDTLEAPASPALTLFVHAIMYLLIIVGKNKQVHLRVKCDRHGEYPNRRFLLQGLDTIWVLDSHISCWEFFLQLGFT